MQHIHVLLTVFTRKVGGTDMLSGSSATAPARQQQAQRRSQDAELLEHLRSIVREHQICYEIWPLWSISEVLRPQRGFELLLCGVNGHAIREGGALHAVPSCQHCAHTYSELREIAEWILHLKKPTFGHEIFSFDCALHLAPPHRLHRSEIVITIAVFHGFNYKTGEKGGESECLKEVRTRLSKLRIPEDVLPAQSGNL
jgi:hypothetical protein